VIDYDAPTATPTPSNTPTVTNTPTNTATGTLPPTDTPTITLTPSETPPASETPTITPTPTETPTPAWWVVITLPAPSLGTAVLIERRFTFGEEAIFFALVGLIALLGLRWIFDWVRAEMVKPVDPRAD